MNVMTARIILGFVTCGALTFSVRRKVRSGKLFGFHSGVDIGPHGVLCVNGNLVPDVSRQMQVSFSVADRSKNIKYIELKLRVFWGVTLCCCVRDSRRFIRTQCPNLRG